MTGLTYEVLEKIAVISESPTGWTKELRLVSWNGRAPRYDLRDWAPGDSKASRGITLSLEEIKKLQVILIVMELPDMLDKGEDPDE